MSVDEASASRTVVSFGPFKLFPARRLLEREGAMIHLSPRAFDILAVLIERANSVVSKEELWSRFWPGVVSDGGSLRVHITALRKALGDGKDGARYLVTLSGRGYCFVAPVSHASPPTSNPAVAGGPRQFRMLPQRLARMVGRGRAIADISKRLLAERFVTIAGPGGIGKTTVAIAVAHELIEAFGDVVVFVDLGTLTDGHLVAGAVASTLGVAVRSDDATRDLVSFLQGHRMLLVLDSCEHLIDAAAVLAERIFKAAPGVHILATSRELLRVEGEHVHHLPPLDTPPANIRLSAARAIDFSAVALFVDRANTSGHRFSLTDANAQLVRDICGRLDGIPLAIELAASRVTAYGAPETLQLLNSQFRLLRMGRRTASSRHQTLGAMLDWSYDLLSDREQKMFRRLSVFAGPFSLGAAIAVAGEHHDGEVVDMLASLVDKSMIAVSAAGSLPRYRMLDATRAHAAAKLARKRERETIRGRHAEYYAKQLQGAGPDPPPVSTLETTRPHVNDIDNIRAALEWSFSESGATAVGVSLAASATRLFLEASLLTECFRWSETALAKLDRNDRGGHREMELQAALGESLMLARGNSLRARRALSRALKLAESLGDLGSQLRLLARLIIFDHRAGLCERAFALAQRGAIVARRIGGPASIAEANWLLGFSNYFIGNLHQAEANWAIALLNPDAAETGIDRDTLTRMRCGLIAVRWLRGFPDQSAEIASETIETGMRFGDPSAFCICLIFAGFAYLRMGRWAEALKAIEQIVTHARRHSLPPFEAIGTGMEGMLSIGRGEAEVGVTLVRDALNVLRAGRYELHNPVLLGGLAEGLGMTGQTTKALTTINDAIARANRNGQAFSLPEFMRIKGELLLSCKRSDPRQAEALFLKSMELARQQSSMGWLLRSATSLARLRRSQDREQEALDVLCPVYESFTEGFETSDLQRAKRLLSRLQI